MQIVLLVAGVVSLFLPHQLETAIVLIAITLLNAAMGLNQEGKASASVAALRKMMVAKARVRRGGELVVIPMEDVVVGDIIAIEAGDLVPADGRILTAATLEIDESALTGESSPVPKQIAAVAPDAALGDRLDMAFMNSQVTRGSGVLMATGSAWRRRSATSAGCSRKRPTRRRRSPSSSRSSPASSFSSPGLALVASIVLGLARDVAFETLFLTAVAFSVSAIPSELPAVVTAILSKGTQELAAAGAIVKRLRSVETLGLDLGDQLRQDRDAHAQPDDRRADGHRRPALHHLRGGLSTVGDDRSCRRTARCPARAIPAADGAVRRRGGARRGAGRRPDRRRARRAGAKGGVDPTLTRDLYPRLATLPFDAAYKLMATFHRMTDADGKEVIRGYVKGAPDQLLARAANALGPDGARSRWTRDASRIWPRTIGWGARACASWPRAGGTSTRRHSIRTPTCCH